MRKKIFTILLALAASVGMMNAKVTWNSSNISDLYVSGTSYSKEGVTLGANADNNYAYWLDYGDESHSGIGFYVNATGGFTFSNTLGKNFTKIEMTLNGSGGWGMMAKLGSGWLLYLDYMDDHVTVTWEGNASTVDLLKDQSDFSGDYVKSIVFYFVGDSGEPDPVSPVTAARFLYTYDCQRNPAYPKQGSPCTLRGFSDPYVGYNGIGSDAKNTPFGPWKLEFAAYYTPSNNYGCESVVRQAVNQYYSSLSNQEKEAKRLEVPIFRLWQYNIVAGEYQHASYGIVCAYADEGNAEDHGALFISSEGNGCFLAGKPHNAQISLSCENDLTTGLNNLVTAASATDPDYDAYMPVILSIDAIGTVELTQHCKDFIEGSSSAYNALTDAQKGQVTNYHVLVDAKNQWAPLVAEAKPYADAVVDLINAIPNPIVYTQSCKNKIDAAQNAYDALTSGQKIFVSNYETLKNALSDLMKAAPYVHILFKANGKEKKFENVTLPHVFTEAEMTTMLKEMYGVEGDYDMFAYTNADAVDISGGKWTINPFMGKVDVNGDLNKFDPETGDMDMISISLEITLEFPPYEPEPEPQPTAVENVQTNHVQATKFFRDGQLLIEKNGKIYNVQGVEVR